jgi:hypothetical protein
VLTPAFKDIAQTFEKEFVGMTVAPVSLDDLLESRRQLVAEIQARLADDRVRAFLMSFHELQPDWPALGLDNIADLPAVRWKLINLAARGATCKVPVRGQRSCTGFEIRP